ncbi:hypothetical protein AB1Y20_001116 [Prymnesium parvum]|uniref:Protochlorophyllide reductase n=1 Tax=Prymnesium parvum TaxID=97485 RepID=A0AB34KCN3_PRYPA
MPLGGWSRCAQVAAFYPEGVAQLAGATTIVTGPTAGIGVATATALAATGGLVVLAARSAEKSAELIAQIHAKDPAARVVHLPLDLASLASVARFAPEFRRRAREERWPPLKCLVLNAGVFPMSHTLSADGYEATFAVSHLAHFLLATELQPELKRAAPSRVVVVSSMSQFGPYATTDFTSIDQLKANVVSPSGEGWSLPRSAKAYAHAKLCNSMMARSIHNKMASEGITACSLHPGTMMATSIGRDSAVVNFLMKYVFSWCTKDMDQGSSTTLACCLAPHDTLQGKFFSDCRVTKHSPWVDNDAACSALWELSNELCAKYRA